MPAWGAPGGGVLTNQQVDEVLVNFLERGHQAFAGFTVQFGNGAAQFLDRLNEILLFGLGPKRAERLKSQGHNATGQLRGLEPNTFSSILVLRMKRHFSLEKA